MRPLIPPPPSAAIITSRRHFSLTEFGLSEPLRLDVLDPADARDLLRAASPKLRSASDADLDRLADLCGRLPLALRVAVSLLNDRDDWAPATLLSRLDDERTRLARLKGDSDPDLDVEAVLRLSYDLLDDDLKAKFRQLGVFTAPFLMISAQAVWDLNDSTEADDLLGKLTNRSLLTPSPLGEGAGGEGELPSPTIGRGAGVRVPTPSTTSPASLPSPACRKTPPKPARTSCAMRSTSSSGRAQQMTFLRKVARISCPPWRNSALFTIT